MCFWLYIVSVDQASQNYTITFTLTGEPFDLIFDLFVDSNPDLHSVSFTCNSKVDCIYDKLILFAIF